MYSTVFLKEAVKPGSKYSKLIFYTQYLLEMDNLLPIKILQKLHRCGPKITKS